MAQVTLSVLEGLERGRIYHNLPTPITIGREEDNVVQLNDERVSRVHAKIQEDRGQVLLTDVNSTNGSRVNGHPVQLRVLQPGDHLQIGRCTLLFGSDQEIADRADRLGVSVAALNPLNHAEESEAVSSGDLDAEFVLADEQSADNLELPLFPGGRPELPDAMSPGQRTRISDVLSYIHEKMRDVSFEGLEPDDNPSSPVIEVPWERWQNLLMLQRDLAAYLSEIANPESDE